MKFFSRLLAYSLISSAAALSGSVSADDTEIFFSDADSVVHPNILFILDDSGSMSTDAGDSSRMQVVKDVTKSLIDDWTASDEKVNIGLMNFNEECTDSKYGYCVQEGGHVFAPVQPLSGNSNDLKAQIDNLYAASNTPLSETLYEAARYFRGEQPYFDEDPLNTATENGAYDSPVEYECQKSHVVFLTDGEPTADDRESEFESEILGSNNSNCDGNCLDEVAEYLATNDISSEHDGDQFVYTSTVGFHTDQQLLSDTADAGDGTYYLADDEESLKKAFKEFYQDVKAQSTTYVAPGIAVNTFDRLNHLNTLYFALFQPSKGARWTGNLKRYKLDIQEQNDGTSEAVIVDADGNAAINEATGFFKDTARSWWSPSSDGKNVGEGGAASQHDDPNSDRPVYSNLSDNSNLTSASNAISVANKGNISKTLLGDAGMSDDQQEKLINWSRGADISDEDGDNNTAESREFIADPLHSVPHLIIYGETNDTPDVSIFFGDNQGYIHGIDGSNGESHFSFMPKELLDNQSELMANEPDASKVYGMDGTVISWVHDENNDGAINSGDSDFAYIYSGMRRGGNSYYALDVTNPDSPRTLWTIQGGSGDFSELGQTWSKPVKTKVKINKTLHEVLVFSGGYDTNQDTVDTAASDTQGRAVYIVDAETGNLLWWAGPSGSGANLEIPELQHSIPASPKVLDLTGDGWANQIYVGDTGGQIFRFDITNTNKVDNLVTGGRIADLSGSGADNRRFFHSPDLFGLKFGGERHLGLVIGSGYQASPLDTSINDRIYMLRIPEVTSPPIDSNGNVDYTAITEDDLYDATDNLIQQGNASEREAAAEALGAAQGWYIRLENSGEKVLSTSRTVNSEVFVTTYEPTPSTNPCVPSTGTSRLYHMSVLDGRAVVNYDGVGGDDDKDLTKNDRPKELGTGGLPANPQRMRVDDTDVVCVGTECTTVDSITGVVETYWFEK